MDQHNNFPVCGLVLDPQPVSASPLTFRRFELVESNSWTGLYGANRFPTRLASTNYGFLGQLGVPGTGDIDGYWGLDDRSTEMTTVARSSHFAIPTAYSYSCGYLPGSRSSRGTGHVHDLSCADVSSLSIMRQPADAIHAGPKPAACESHKKMSVGHGYMPYARTTSPERGKI